MARHGKRLFLLGPAHGVAELAAANLKTPTRPHRLRHLGGYFREDGPVVQRSGPPPPT